MKNRGVTLVELMVVITIIGILAVALGYSYFGWAATYKVEKATKDIYSDLMTARSMAMTRSHDYFVDFPTTTTYRMSVDDSNGVAKPTNGSGGDGTFQPQADPAVVTNDTDTTLPTFPKTIEYTINSSAGGTVIFDGKGMISAPLLPTDGSADVAICLSTTADSDYDCIEISQTRILMGKLTPQGSPCNATNCVAK